MNKVLDSIAEQIGETLEELRSLAKSKKQAERIDYLAERLEALCAAYEDLLREKAEREENARQREEFLGCYRWLAGQAKEMSAQAAKRPETKCREFKAFLMNGVLMRLRETLEADMEVSLPLVSEQEGHSYSDVSLLLRSYMDLCAGYAEKHYNLRFDFQGRQLPPGRFGYGHRI